MKKGFFGVSKLVEGHVLDVAKTPLVAALRRFDPQLYVKWNPKKNQGRGTWELRRKPELKSVREGRSISTPYYGDVLVPGDVYDMGGWTLAVPKYNENHTENHVKDFDYLTYDMLAWVSSHDLWVHGFRGKLAMDEADYREQKYIEKEENEAAEERNYMIKQHRTEFNDFREYILAGGNPARLVDYWGK